VIALEAPLYVKKIT